MDMSMLNKLREHLASISSEQFQAEWEEIEAMGFGGPSVQDFLKTLKLTPTVSEIKVVEQYGSETSLQYTENQSSFALAA